MRRRFKRPWTPLWELLGRVERLPAAIPAGESERRRARVLPLISERQPQSQLTVDRGSY